MFKRLAYFYVTITGDFESLQYFNFGVKKLEYRFSVESTKIEIATFPYKNALRNTSINSGRMGSTKWACQKE